MTHLDVWYAHVRDQPLLVLMRNADARQLERTVPRKAPRGTNRAAFREVEACRRRGASNHRRPTPDRARPDAARPRRRSCDVTAAIRKRDYYVRQLRDMKGSISVDKLSPSELIDHARACGAVLARAHARSGDPVAIAACLGGGDAFERAIYRLRPRTPTRPRAITSRCPKPPSPPPEASPRFFPPRRRRTGARTRATTQVHLRGSRRRTGPEIGVHVGRHPRPDPRRGRPFRHSCQQPRRPQQQATQRRPRAGRMPRRSGP